MAKLKQEHSPYVPASVFESPKFHKRVNRLFAVALPLNIGASYFVSAILFLMDVELTNLHFRYAGIISDQIKSLADHDGLSHYSYVGTLLVGIPSGVVVAISTCYAYWRDVIGAGLGRKFESRTFLGLVVYAALMGFIVWFAFFTRVDWESAPRRAGVFLWPFFPLFGSMCSFLAAILSVTIFGGIYKIVAQLREGLKR